MTTQSERENFFEKFSEEPFQELKPIGTDDTQLFEKLKALDLNECRQPAHIPNGVYHPEHYTLCSIECIDNMKIMFGSWHTLYFCLLNAYKYLVRHEFKGGMHDILKALNYLGIAKEIAEKHGFEMPRQYEELKIQCEDVLEEYNADESSDTDVEIQSP